MTSSARHLATISLLVAASCGGTAATAPPPEAPEPTRAVAKPVVKPPRPRPSCKFPPPDESAAPAPAPPLREIPEAERTIAGLRGRFRACYQAGLNLDHELDGCVIVQVRVAPDGAVESATPAITDRLSPKVIECLAGALRRAQFVAPGGDDTITLYVPITFVQADR